MSTNVGKVGLVQKLEQTSPSQIVNLPEVANRFKDLYALMNGGNNKTAEIKYESEKFHFAKLIQDNKPLQECTKLSLYGCFLDMAVNGLSFDTAMKHAYVVAFSNNVGTRDNPKWEKRATLMVSGYGELHIRTAQGQIKYADNPILVYENDMFKHGTKDGKVFLEHLATYPRTSDNIIACYIRLERPDSTVDYKVLSIEEIMKLKKFSKDPNSKAWTDGLPGMVQAKTIKHAFRSYPKVKLGQFSQLQSETIEAEPERVIDYGIDEAELPPAKGTFTPVMVVEPVKQQRPQPVNDDDFAEPAARNESNSVSHEDDDF